MTIADAARALGVSRTHAYRMAAEGAIPVVRVGRALKVPRAAWSSWLRKKTEAALASLRAADQGWG